MSRRRRRGRSGWWLLLLTVVVATALATWRVSHWLAARQATPVGHDPGSGTGAAPAGEDFTGAERQGLEDALRRNKADTQP